MTHIATLLAGAAVLVTALAGPVFAQGAPQTLSLMKVDTATLATGYRTSKVVGSAVLNETGEQIGAIDDLIVTTSDQVPFAVLSVGGFLGVGTKYVVVPASALEVRDNKMVLVGGTKDTLKSLPGYTYTK